MTLNSPNLQLGEAHLPIAGPFYGAEAIASTREREADYKLIKASNLATSANQRNEEVLKVAELVSRRQDKLGLQVDVEKHAASPPLPQSFIRPSAAQGEKQEQLGRISSPSSGYVIPEYKSDYEYNIPEYRSMYDPS